MKKNSYHSHPSADLRRPVVSYCLEGLPRNSVAKLTDCARNDKNVSKGRKTPTQQQQQLLFIV